MSPKALETFILSLAAVTLSIQWGGSHVFKIGGKMFALSGSPDEKFRGLIFKVSEESFAILMDQKGIERAPYLTRGNWVRLTRLSALTDKQLKGYLARSHAIVGSALSKKKRESLGIAAK